MRGVTSSGIEYTRRGSGRPVVLLHGWCLSGRLWSYEEELLAGSFDVVVPDLPGFGRSDGLDGPFDLDRYQASVSELLDELALNDAVVVGFAFGALVAMALAAADELRVGGLVLIGVPAASRFAYSKMPAAMRRDWPLFASRSARAICGQPQSDATLDWLGRMFEATPLPVAIEVNGLLGSTEPSALAPSVRVPSLFVHGAQDTVVPVEVAEECVALMPSARLAVVEECGHLVPLDQKQRFHELVLEFMAERAPVARP
jgi:pimeloyl-ACP methyl ester carboxylesterase